ncbi:maltokinase N-terminal cap-like domain-containing protein [Knoellia subterranea]|uniref:Maltokinase n=1 Tax=Knoellia subterranea KCTC 19937 TaxID=1385521 RepID=A0A0A0JRC3_9MICO|nr:phosphotransferase [Knoellia subterranea]KGN39279.1 aminoglycoside phosphotransferase [Knoellia subterranea KCTC 19937]
MAEILDATLTPSKRELVEAWMGSQRWYAGKGTSPDVRRLASWRLGDPAGQVGVEVMIVADVSGASPVVYQVPLTYRGAPLPGAEDALVGTMEHSVLGPRWVYDAPHDPVYTTALLELIQGRVRAESSSASDEFDDTVVATAGPTWSHAVTVRGSSVLKGEQSNTSIVLDCVSADGSALPVIVKVFRMLSAGENPDVVLQSALRAAGSERVPAVVGSVAGQWPEPDPAATADGETNADGGRTAYGHFVFAQEFLPGVEDAWRVALRAVRLGEDFTGPARALGEATAEVHATLATALGTTATSPDVARTIVDEMRARYAAAADEVPALHDHDAAVAAILDAALDVNWPALQRIHGDYHLGQVLHTTDDGWMLLDFEGEPLRPLAERSQPDQWIRDIAGMLRSFDYAGGAVEHSGGESARAWVASAQQAFLDGYAAVAHEDPRRRPALLAAFELDKAMYEVVYEVRNRPSWVDIPLAAIERLATQFSTPPDSPAPSTTTSAPDAPDASAAQEDTP